jgi:DNA-binding helix-hairpin-helix protein with protein kinase domain
LSIPPPDPDPRVVRDRQGREYELDGELGHGGQGTVFGVRNQSLAIKICRPDGGRFDNQSLSDRLARLRWLPLEDLPVSRPVEVLDEPFTGYVMERLQDMVPMSELTSPPRGADLLDWYASRGGLRRRLRLLARCAETLAVTHGRGIVYGDFSPGNVFVSQSLAHEQVWLIDADNLSVESGAVAGGVYTPPFAAPELLCRRSGNTPFTDAHSFAVVAYQALVGDHPLFGDLVANGPVELERDAQLGLLPWVGHANDARNRSSEGLKPGRVLTAQLHALFARSFQGGMTNPMQRPEMGSWAAALAGAADRSLSCPNPDCGAGYYAHVSRCPWCGVQRPPVLLAKAWDLVPMPTGPGGRRELATIPTSEALIVQAGDVANVSTRLTWPLKPDSYATAATLHWDGGPTLVIRNAGDLPLRLVPPAGGRGRQLLPGAQVVSPIDRVGAAWSLHAGDDVRPHRALTIDPMS